MRRPAHKSAAESFGKHDRAMYNPRTRSVGGRDGSRSGHSVRAISSVGPYWMWWRDWQVVHSAFALILLLLGSVAFAQNSPGVITGTVTDPDKAIVAGVQVQARHIAT